MGNKKDGKDETAAATEGGSGPKAEKKKTRKAPAKKKRRSLILDRLNNDIKNVRGQIWLQVFAGGMGCNYGLRAVRHYASGKFFVGCRNYRYLIKGAPGAIEEMNFLFLNPDRAHLSSTIHELLEAILTDILADLQEDALTPEPLKKKVTEFMDSLSVFNHSGAEADEVIAMLTEFLEQIVGGVDGAVRGVPDWVKDFTKKRMEVIEHIYWCAYSSDGNGAESNPEKGKKLLREAMPRILKLEGFYPKNTPAAQIPEIHEIFTSADGVITTAGMGGGSGTPAPLELGFTFEQLKRDKRVKPNLVHIAKGTMPFDWDEIGMAAAQKFVADHYKLRPMDPERKVACLLSTGMILYSNSKLVAAYADPNMKIAEALQEIANTEILRNDQALFCLLGNVARMNIDPGDFIGALAKTSHLWLYSLEVPYKGEAITEEEIGKIPEFVAKGFRDEEPEGVNQILMFIESENINGPQLAKIVQNVRDAMKASRVKTKIGQLILAKPIEVKPIAGSEEGQKVIHIYVAGFAGGELQTVSLGAPDAAEAAPDILSHDVAAEAAATLAAPSDQAPEAAGKDAAAGAPDGPPSLASAPAPASAPAGPPPAPRKPDDELDIPAFLRSTGK